MGARPGSRAAILIALLLGASATTAADSARENERLSSWRAAMNTGHRARRSGSVRVAEASFRRALTIASRRPARLLRVAEAENALADLYLDSGRYAEAVSHYSRALELWVRLLGPGQPAVATTRHNLAAARKLSETARDPAPRSPPR